MNITGSVIAVLELVGAAAFAISGAFAAIKKNADAFGVIFPAAGGGVMRDILLGIIPPKIFSDWTYIAVAAGSSLAVFIFALAARERFARNMDRIDRINNIFDAAGLGIFAVYGAKTVLDCGHQNVLLVLFISMLSGVGGGIIRDTLINEMPFVLKKRIYAVAAMIGGGIFYLLYRYNVNGIICIFSGAAAVFALRMFATRFKWNLPRVNIGL